MATQARLIDRLDGAAAADLGHPAVCRDGLSLCEISLRMTLDGWRVLAFERDGRRIGTALACVDGRELVVIGLAGLSGVGLVDLCWTLAHRIAWRLRCRSIRAHCRPGLARVLARRTGVAVVGRRPGEIVLRRAF